MLLEATGNPTPQTPPDLNAIGIAFVVVVDNDGDDDGGVVGV